MIESMIEIKYLTDEEHVMFVMDFGQTDEQILSYFARYHKEKIILEIVREKVSKVVDNENQKEL